MPKELVVSTSPHETLVAVLEDGQLCEIYIEREKEFALVGSIYKGRVTRVLPGMQSAFVDIGLDGDAFLYVSDFLEDIEEYDHIVATVEDKVQKMEQQGGQVFGPSAPSQPPSPESARVTSPPEDSPQPAAGKPAEGVPPPRGSYAQPQPGSERRGYSHGRGRHGRWGRRRGPDSRHGRELPPSKYASPRPYEPPRTNYEVEILPGESLAKYKNRIPVAPPPVPSSPEPTASMSEPQPESPGITEPLPASPAAPRAAQEPLADGAVLPLPPEPVVSAPARETAEPPAEPARVRPELAAGIPEEHVPSAAPAETELTPEEATALAEQLAEAQQEEAEAETAEEENEAGEAEEIEPAEVFQQTYEAIEPQAEPEPLATSEAEPGVAQGTEPHAATPPIPAEPNHYSARIQDNWRARFQRPMRRGGRRRGGFRPRPHERPQGPHRTQQISELLKPGQEIIVQIAKEPLGKKGARITSHIALPGRFLVYMPTLDHIGVSRKISSAEERTRLRRLVLELKGSLTGGFIVRTAADGTSDEEIRSDVEFLGKTWNDIRARAEQRKAPALLHRDLNLIERILRDYLSPDYTAIWVDSEEEFAKVVEFVSRFQPGLANRVKLYTKETPIFEEFGIQQELDKALRPKVWLKSGGYIVINHTEALVAIDVNTGKFVGKGSTRLEDTIIKTNLEAVKEIMRQIRLRDLGGIIVIDFIDMEERRNREKVMQALEAALQTDRAPSKALAFNEFGLVAITRKRTKQALERVLCQPCPYCTGSGMVKSTPTICYEIQAEARKMAPEIDSQSLTLRTHPEIAKALKTRESALIEELERWTRKSIIIQADPTLHWEQYDIY